MDGLAPLARADRIDVLDILRGLAILGIFYMNIPSMGASVALADNDLRAIGWSVADQTTWAITEVLLEGTQRAMLEFLFGAGMLVLARRAMIAEGPVAVADLYYRRNLWLVGFGLIDVFVMLWPGDILHIYGLAALALFPFRRLAPQWLLALGLLFAALSAIWGGIDYASRAELQARVEAIATRPVRTAITPAQRATLAVWQRKIDTMIVDKDEQRQIDDERAARTAGAGAAVFVPWVWQTWFTYVGEGSLVWGGFEAWCATMIGAALFKWGVIQGRRSTRFYVRVVLVAYAFGLSARAIGVVEVFTFQQGAKTIWFTAEFARLATALGHVALVNLLVKTASGARWLAPFKAVGRAAFSIYFLEQSVAIMLFAPFALGWWGQYSYASLSAIATVTIVALLIAANIWSRYFVTGPLEWAWRSLAYLERQPFRRVSL